MSRSTEILDNEMRHEHVQFVKGLINDHLPPKFDKFKKADNNQRWRISDKQRLCYCCLLVHSKGVCQSRKSCGVNECTRFHHPLLHKDEFLHVLRVVTIQIRAATVLNTFAICDEGSTNTLLDQSILTGQNYHTVADGWTRRRNNLQISEVSFEVAGAGINTEWHKLNGARTIQNLNLTQSSIDLEFLMKEYPYLPRDELQKIVGSKPMLLIGQDNQFLMVARKVIKPNPNGSMVTKTKIG
jgi:hypothetical protein